MKVQISALLVSTVLLTGCMQNHKAPIISAQQVDAKQPEQPAAADRSTEAKPVATPEAADQQDENTADSYKVQPGDTLSQIAHRFGYNYRRLAAANNIKPPYHIQAGQVLQLQAADVPADACQQTPATSSQTDSQQASSAEPKEPKSKQHDIVSSKACQGSRKVADINWSWPACGQVVNAFNSNQDNVAAKGITIKSKTGQPVRAAAAGTVIYSGVGSSGYGKMIIIAHQGQFLTAYGHNAKLIAKEGAKVAPGQTIAKISGADKGGYLHFEIRKSGVPVAPLHYLPQ